MVQSTVFQFLLLSTTPPPPASVLFNLYFILTELSKSRQVGGTIFLSHRPHLPVTKVVTIPLPKASADGLFPAPAVLVCRCSPLRQVLQPHGSHPLSATAQQAVV